MKFNIFNTRWWNEKEIPFDVKHTGLGSYKEENGFWYVDINSLEELIALIKKAGTDIVVSDISFKDDTNPSIEIYDDYRE